MIRKLFRIALSIGVSLSILALLLQMFTSGLPARWATQALA